jgi:hypothetical protein
VDQPLTFRVPAASCPSKRRGLDLIREIAHFFVLFPHF